MKLSDEDLREFQEIWRSTFHEEISIEEARHIATDVIKLYALLGHPAKREQQSETDQTR